MAFISWNSEKVALLLEVVDSLDVDVESGLLRRIAQAMLGILVTNLSAEK